MENDLKPTKWVSPEIICSYPNLAEPASEDYGGKYKISIPLPKKQEKALAALREVMMNAAENKWGASARDQVGKSIKQFVEDSDFDDRYKEDPVYQGTMRFAAKSGRRPGCVFPNLQSVPVEDIEDVFYPGAVVRVSVSAYGTDTGGSKTIAFSLNNVMFVRDGERIGGGSKAEDDFADFADNDYDRFEQAEQNQGNLF